MLVRSLVCCVVLLAGSFVNGMAASAATMTLTPSSNPPVVDDADIAQLIFGTQLSAPDSNDAIYLYSDRPAQGQSFTTGSNPLGYILDAVTFQRHAALGGAAGGNPLPLRLTQLSGSTITVLHSETAPEASFSGGNEYITFTFDTPQLLAPNTIYGFDAGMTLGGFAITANNADPYAGGMAYSSGDNGIGTLVADFRDGDRVFHINLAEVLPPVLPAPEPASATLLVSGLLLIARRRRK